MYIHPIKDPALVPLTPNCSCVTNCGRVHWWHVHVHMHYIKYLPVALLDSTASCPSLCSFIFGAVVVDVIDVMLW